MRPRLKSEVELQVMEKQENCATSLDGLDQSKQTPFTYTINILSTLFHQSKKLNNKLKEMKDITKQWERG